MAPYTDTLNSVFRPKIAVYCAIYGMNSSVYGVLKIQYGAVYGVITLYSSSTTTSYTKQAKQDKMRP